MWRNPGETGMDANGNEKATNKVDDDGNGYVDDVFGIDAEHGTGDPMDTGYYSSPGSTPYYHGTLLAGLVGAVGNNRVGISGVNWSVRMMAVRNYGDLSALNALTVRSVYLSALDYLVMMKRRGVNIRVTVNSQYSNDWSLALRDGFAAAGREGILNVGIAGNAPGDQDLYPISYPGTYNEPSILCVAASTRTDTLASFSGFGRGSVDLAAPGVDIYSSVKGGYLGGNEGTSFACPLVAGAAALVLSAHPHLTVDGLKAALLGSVDSIPALKGKVATGGRLNVARALTYATNTDAPPIIIYASPANQRTLADEPIEVTFSQPMDRASVEQSFSVQPAVVGLFEWSSDDRSFIYRPTARFDIRTNYTVRILGTAHDMAGRSIDGTFNRLSDGTAADDYSWSFRFPLPNDEFATAQEIPDRSGSVSANALFGGYEFGEWDLLFGTISTGSTLWYRWTAPEAGGWFTFDLTDGTAFDSVLAIMTGDKIQNVATAASNDNHGSKLSSRVSFQSAPGRIYSILVASKASSSSDLTAPSKVGKFKLDWYPTPPPGFTGSQFSATSAAPGIKITLTGTNLTGATAVLFNQASASFTNAAGNNLDLRITATVPPDATTGPVSIVTPHGTVTSTIDFQVIRPLLTATRGAEGQLVLSWIGGIYSLESSTNLNVWSLVAPLGTSKATVNINEEKRFFRLR